MFENQTFEEIMERMLERISDEIDKRENSVIWNALAPAAAELALSYIWLDQVLNLVYADTAEAGLERYQASKAIWAAAFTDGVSVPPEPASFWKTYILPCSKTASLNVKRPGQKETPICRGGLYFRSIPFQGLKRRLWEVLKFPAVMRRRMNRCMKVFDPRPPRSGQRESDALQTMGRRSGRRGQSEGLSAVEWRGNRKGCHYKRENGTCL